MTNILENPIFADEHKAREWLEARVWPKGPVCPHCKNSDQDAITALRGKAHRPGLYQCNKCREQFTVTVGTVFERSKIPLTKWLATLFLLTSSKKGMSTHQIHRTIGVSYKSTWFMTHRLREAMRTGGFEPQMGGGGKVVEADETYYGKADEMPVSPQRKGRPFIKRGRFANNRPIVALVERGGSVRTFHIAVADQATVSKIVRDNVKRDSRVHTDESKLYSDGLMGVMTHETVKHSDNEYVRGDVTTNTVESYFSVFKRGMRGTYQHCAEKHLHRYLAEFDFRHNSRTALGVTDAMRAELLAKGIVGKRLTYRRPDFSDIPFDL